MEKFRNYINSPKQHLLTLVIGFVLALVMSLFILILTYTNTSNPPTMTAYYLAMAPGTLLMLCSIVFLLGDLIRYFTNKRS